MTQTQADRRLANYLRTHRKNTGLTQWELAEVLGYQHQGAISRHEYFLDMPPLPIAIGYEVVFRIPVSEIFAGVRDDVEEEVEGRLEDLERVLGRRSARERDAMSVARKLMWLNERKSATYQSLP